MYKRLSHEGAAIVNDDLADFAAETISPKQIELLSGHLANWEHISFDDKRKVVDGLISQIRATSDYVQIEWKI